MQSVTIDLVTLRTINDRVSFCARKKTSQKSHPVHVTQERKLLPKFSLSLSLSLSLSQVKRVIGEQISCLSLFLSHSLFTRFMLSEEQSSTSNSGERARARERERERQVWSVLISQDQMWILLPLPTAGHPLKIKGKHLT